jgi:alpha-tubulin suppressor-like RCC1 family protein
MSNPRRVVVVLLGLVLTLGLYFASAASAEDFVWSDGSPETASSTTANWLGDTALVSSSGIGGIREAATDTRHASDATLRIVVRALPRSLSAEIVLAGPRHLHKRVARSVSLKLPAGVYALSSDAVKTRAGAYYATAPHVRQRLRAGHVTTVTVSYATLVPKTTRVVPASGTVSLLGEPSGPRVLTLTGVAARNVKLGQFLASGSTTAAPNGYLVKVTKVTHKDNGIAVLDVQDATLLEALPSGEIDAEAPLEPPAEAASLRGGRAPDLTLGHSRGSPTAHAAGFSLHTTNLTCQSSAGVHVEKPTVTFSPSIALHARWGFLKLDSASFTATVAASLAMGANAEAGASCETNNPGIGLLPHPISLPDIDVQIGPVPVVITPRLQVYLSGNASITAKVSVSLEQSASATVGASYEHGSFVPISSFSQHFRPSFTAEGDASGELALTPTLDTLIYGVAGPSFDIGAVAKLNADVKKTPWWTLQGCLQAGLGFVISPLGLNWSDPHLIQLCKTLLSATSGPPLSAIAASSPPANTSPPTITDEQGNNPPKVGDTLHAGTGSWTGSPNEYIIHWEDCKPAGTCTSNFLSSAAPIYKVTEHDLGDTLRVVVTATNGAGSSQPAVSPETGVVGGHGGGAHVVATAVANGGFYTCALLSTGGVACWGANTLGELGDGLSTGPEECLGFACSTKAVSVVGMSDATAITANSSETCALLSTGGVDCWGGGPPRCHEFDSCITKPMAVTGITDATAIAGSCALLSTGAVDCWGGNLWGELGDGTTEPSEVPVQVHGITNATAISSQGADACALLSTGAVDCWGDNSFGQLGDATSTGPEKCYISAEQDETCSTTPVAVTGITDARAIATSAGQTCAVLSKGGVDCWGENDFGQLGDGSSAGPERCMIGTEPYLCSTIPVAVSNLTNATTITVGIDDTCALLSTGEVDCWGVAEDGALGDNASAGPEECRLSCSRMPVTVSGITDATAVAAGQNGVCAALSVSGVDCWGVNSVGQLGDGTSSGPETCVSPTNEDLKAPCSIRPVEVIGIE